MWPEDCSLLPSIQIMDGGHVVFQKPLPPPSPQGLQPPALQLLQQQGRMSQGRPLVWLSDATDRRIVAVRGAFLRGLQQQSRNVINYYDFLLVAKRLNFRFEESSHLMELRKYFFNHKNQILNKKLANLLCVEEQSLNDYAPQRTPEKIIIRFRVGEQIESIQELTNQDEEAQSEEGEEETVPYGQSHRLHSEEKPEESQQYRQKLTIILSIKVAQMVRKLKLLTEGVPPFEEQQPNNLLTVFANLTQDIPYEIFRKGVVGLLRQMEAQFFRERLTMSEDDIRALYSMVDTEGEGKVQKEQLGILQSEAEMARRITKFYEARINKRMVKNTLFKLGKNSNSIQIYQVKNASVLEFRNIEDGLLEPHRKERPRPKQPHFGPIKGTSRPSPAKLDNSRQNKSSLSTYKREGEHTLERQREKIERIIRSSKQQKKRQGNDTIANKLRKLFIHKVILPRQRLLEQQKQKYLGVGKAASSHIIAKLT